MTKDMGEEAKVRLERFNAQQADWWAVCRRCGWRIGGTLAEIQKHAKECRCGEQAP